MHLFDSLNQISYLVFYASMKCVFDQLKIKLASV